MKSIYEEFFGDPVDHPVLMRTLAFAIDYGLLFFTGMAIHSIFSLEEAMTRFGFATLNALFFCTYFTVAHSSLVNGQTLGKKIFRIKVSQVNGAPLGLFRAFLRSFPIVILIFAEPISFYMRTFWPEQVVAFKIVFAVLSGLLLGVVYFSMVSKNRRGLHDIFAKSQVTPARRKVTTNSKTEAWKIISYLLILVVYLVIILPRI